MAMLNSIRLIVGIFLFVVLGINFIYQAIRAFRKLRMYNYSEETTHHFKCRECQETYAIDGKELQEKTNIWSRKLEIQTPTRQMHAIRFVCPICLNKTFQEKVYDTDVTGMRGNIRAQFDQGSREIILDILIKGVLPIFIGMPLLGLLL